MLSYQKSLASSYMTIANLIKHLNAMEDKDKEIRFTDIATNYKFRLFCIDKKNEELIIEDTGENKYIC